MGEIAYVFKEFFRTKEESIKQSEDPESRSAEKEIEDDVLVGDVVQSVRHKEEELSDKAFNFTSGRPQIVG